MSDMTQQNASKSLKSMDFVAWRVGRKKAEREHVGVHRVLFNRPRLRRETQH